MTWYVYFNAICLAVISLYWVTYVLTITHVWLYVLLSTTLILGGKTILPYSFLLLIIIFMWWGMYGGYGYTCISHVLYSAYWIVFGRNFFPANV